MTRYSKDLEAIIREAQPLRKKKPMARPFHHVWACMAVSFSLCLLIDYALNGEISNFKGALSYSAGLFVGWWCRV